MVVGVYIFFVMVYNQGSMYVVKVERIYIS
jgi:hypothetical protein